VEDLETLAYLLDKPDWGLGAALIYETELSTFYKHYKGSPLRVRKATIKTPEVSVFVSKKCGYGYFENIRTKLPVNSIIGNVR
jgi:hypothetical protein